MHSPILGLQINSDKEIEIGMKGLPSNITAEGKNKLVRRAVPDNSQRIRRTVQWLFAALNVTLVFV